jgi:iron complex outermembrane receptor protein
MNDTIKKYLLQSTMIAGLATAGFAMPAHAQVADEDLAVDVISEEEADEGQGDQIVVTGSRLKRDAFTSTAPIQVITSEDAAEQGLFSAVDILQTNAAASGQQIDSTFQGFVLDNGPGSETINLRALGADRTLVLLNGRRIGPSGAEGSPTQPSVNLIPNTMVDRIDLLLDGASAVYGSDAVAGVVNVILKNDYDGLELDAFADTPEQGAGQDYFLGARYGINADRGFIGGAVEFTYQDPWAATDRDFLNNNGLGCETFREITESGEIRTNDVSNTQLDQLLGLTSNPGPCRATRLTQRFATLDGGFGSVYFQPDINNTGLGFSESGLFGVPIDGNGDGVRDVVFSNFSPNGQQSEFQQIANEQEQISLFANGEYTFEGDSNTRAYFEVLHVERDIEATSQQPQLFPTVPGNNPFNPCNIENNDCGAAYNAVIADPTYLANFATFLNSDLNPFGTNNCFGIPEAFCTPQTFGLNRATGVSLDVLPIVGIRGDRNVTNVSLNQTRVVAGFGGDLPTFNKGPLNDWSYDVSAQYSYSRGESLRTGVREDRLNLALGIDPVTGATLDAPCEGAENFAPEIGEGCVPVNLFAPSLLNTAAGGEFATQAERDFLFGDRTFDTRIGQLVLSGFVQGNVLELPGGSASILLGAEYREDTIDSDPNNVASDGLLFGFFADGGAVGDVTNRELFGELSLPLGTGKTGLRELNIDLAGRVTDNEFYGTNFTYSAKAGWRPIDSLLLRATYGTSFRAPNTRELFLRAQTAFNNQFFDICAVPDAAFIGGGINGGTPVYDRSADPRNDRTLDNCRLDGVDPEVFRANNAVYSVEVQSGGVANGGVPGFEDLDPETSTSLTVGGSFEQPFFDSFDATFGVTYFNLDIEDSIFGTGSQFVANSCYTGSSGLQSRFCGLFDRGADGDVGLVATPFLNLNNETAEFIDYNFRFDKSDIALLGKSWDVFGRTQISQYLSRTNELVANSDGDVEFDELVGEFGVPEWTGSATLGFNQDRWSAAWTTRFISGVAAPEEDDRPIDPDANNRLLAVDGFTNAFDTVNTFNGAGSVVTCLGPDFGDENCRTVSTAPDYFVHNLSAAYTGDDWGIRIGVNNVFDKAPPLVSPREVLSINNVPIGNGYDLQGREYFVRASKTF